MQDLQQRLQGELSVLESCLRKLRNYMHRFEELLEDKGKIKPLLSQLEEVEKRAHDDKVSLSFLGEFNAGKSSLINALFEIPEDYKLKEGATPTTDRVCQVVYGEEYDIVERDNIRTIKIPYENLRNIKILDTPGTNSPFQEHTQKAKESILKSDFIIFISSIDQPFSESQKNFLREIKERGGMVLLYIINKSDQEKSEEGRQKIYDYVRQQLNQIGLSTVEILFVSVKDGENLQKLKDILLQNLYKLFKDKVNSVLEKARVVRNDLEKRVVEYLEYLEEHNRKYKEAKRTLMSSISRLERHTQDTKEIIQQRLKYFEDEVKEIIREYLKPSIVGAMPIIGKRSINKKKKQLAESIKKPLDEVQKVLGEKQRELLKLYEAELKKLKMELELIGGSTKSEDIPLFQIEPKEYVLWHFEEVVKMINSIYATFLVKDVGVSAFVGGGVGAVGGGVLGAVGTVGLFEPTTALLVGIPAGIVSGIVRYLSSRRKFKGTLEKEWKKIDNAFENLKNLYGQALDIFLSGIRTSLEEDFRNHYEDKEERERRVVELLESMRGELVCLE